MLRTHPLSPALSSAQWHWVQLAQGHQKEVGQLARTSRDRVSAAVAREGQLCAQAEAILTALRATDSVEGGLGGAEDTLPSLLELHQHLNAAHQVTVQALEVCHPTPLPLDPRRPLQLRAQALQDQLHEGCQFYAGLAETVLGPLQAMVAAHVCPPAPAPAGLVGGMAGGGQGSSRVTRSTVATASATKPKLAPPTWSTPPLPPPTGQGAPHLATAAGGLWDPSIPLAYAPARKP
jgi:hypothetical protein